jgi:hypothetical protein
MTMTNRIRVAITIVSALALGITEYGSRWTAADPGIVSDVWGWSGMAAYLFAIVAVALVYRWWALLPALAPTAAVLYLEYLTDYEPPWEREPLILPVALLIAVFCIQVALQAGVLALGFLGRLIWDSNRDRWLSRRGRVPSPRG